MKKKLLGVLLCVAMVGTMLVGCGDKKSDGGDDKKDSGDSGKKKDIKVGFAMKTQDSPYFVKLVETVEKLCKENGWKCTTLDAGGDTAKETENIETFISQDMDLIFLDSVEPDACIPAINAAADADIGVINLDSGVGEGAKDVTTVYSDNKQNGRKVGLAYAEKMKGKEIKAILLSGAKGNVAGKERRMGLFAGIIEGQTGCTEDEAWKASEKFENDLTSGGKAENKDAKFSVGGQGWGNWTEEEGLAAADDLITANKDLNCVLGENDQMLFGAMTSLKNANIKNVDIVAAADGAQKAYDLIKTGEYFATGENSPILVAQKGVEIAKEILVDGKDKWGYDDITLTEAVAVTKDNVDDRYDYGF